MLTVLLGAFSSVGGNPLFIERGEGAYIWDADGNRYIDYVSSWGPLILGHRSQHVSDAIVSASQFGTSFGAPTHREVEFAELVCQKIPSIDLIRYVSSGTEATMSALRLARAYTKRDCVIKFNGCYHGHADAFLVEAGSGVATCGIAGSPGVPQSVAELTLSIEYNSPEKLLKTIESVGENRIAAIIIEPVAANMGLILPEPGYLSYIRELADKIGALLIFDEVISGFRLSFGGAASLYNVCPDLVTYGKIIGGGLPVGAFGGREEIMRMLAPDGPVYQAGTLSGNPLAMAAGLATVKRLMEVSPYGEMERLTKKLVAGFSEVVDSQKVSFSQCGSLFSMFFSKSSPKNYNEVCQCNTELYKKFFWGMIERGFYFAPSAFEVGFLSAAHSEEMIDRTIEAGQDCLTEMDL